jgi:hypothetical protein
MRPPKEKHPTPPPKKPYRKPVVRYYGGIRALTEDIGSMNMADGGTLPKIRTTV